jgi:prepilin-type N-terminal cleavage/methylation domain-containing protein
MKITKGFTLIELLVVIAIIGILSSVVLVSLSTARMKARDARRIADFKQIMLALELYYDAKSYYPGSNNTSGSPPCSFPALAWDCNGYQRSNVTGAVQGSWDYLQTELGPYLSKVPVDPINTTTGGCAPWSGAVQCYTYAYGNPGRYTKPTYDLIARLETPNHPQNATNNNWMFGYGISDGVSSSTQQNPNGIAWSGYVGGNLYDPSPN